MFTVSASEFKAKCLTLLDHEAETGEEILVTKRGAPLARLVPLEDFEQKSLRGSVSYSSEQDLLSPIDETWDATK